MGGFVVNTEADRKEMLDALSCESVDELFSPLPAQVRLKKPLKISEGQSELEAARAMKKLAAQNVVFPTIFRGAGAYRHYIPAAVKSIAAKEEFVTAYTPYQAEISQGMLQSIFEYQTMICELTGMDAANASVYDGASAAAEAAAMCRDKGRTKTIISAAAHPQVIETVRTYCEGADVPLTVVPQKDGRTDVDALLRLLDGETACVYIQQPNFYGTIEDMPTIESIVHAAGAKLVLGCNPIALALLKSPKECGADIAVGEGQPLGLPLAFGGPYLGFMACTAPLLRKLPGRIVGETIDGDGNRAFVLTLQSREQHIRREKASSNICSNQALCALTAAIYLSTMGPAGLHNAATACLCKAHYAAERISGVTGFSLLNRGSFFHEFVTRCPKEPEVVLAHLEQQGILGGYPLEGEYKGCLLWCVTELNTKAEIDTLVRLLEEVALL